MNRLVPALALALVVGTPVVAEDSNLRAVLSVLPDTVFSDLTPDVARYLDLSALAEAHGGTLRREALRALLGAASARQRRLPSALRKALPKNPGSTAPRWLSLPASGNRPARSRSGALRTRKLRRWRSPASRDAASPNCRRR